MKNIENLNFPPAEIPQKVVNNKTYLYDIVRRKYVVSGPEEWVRQHLLHFLIFHKNYPKNLISVEKGVKVLAQHRRYDIVVYNSNGVPCLLAECKSYKIALNQKTFNQATLYNLNQKVPYLLITNGLQHFCCKIDFATKTFSYLQDIPEYSTLDASFLNK
ncbi:MAG: type I restriction enzyme HsdR N-terminal domain-containing protein [Chitinophagales bacterium]|nr:type I restriction enzyme HsdR N-terminal domain-containing protein [Bacteroidota bacterium]MCB9043734.1 type I restriction enzyme HsdR N-terminal domain-containing protein [Chitinophagales bacterium]